MNKGRWQNESMYGGGRVLPYVVGGVSSWVQSMIKSFPATEFVILAIIADRKLSREVCL